MKTKRELFEGDWSGLHDVIVDSLSVAPSREEAEKVFKKLPQRVQEIAFEWGMSDTEFRDAAYDAIEEHQIKIEH